MASPFRLSLLLPFCRLPYAVVTTTIRLRFYGRSTAYPSLIKVAGM